MPILNSINFTIPGAPIGKGRPRFARHGAHVVAYTPHKTVNFEAVVKIMASQAMAGKSLLTRPVALHIDMYMPIPASWSKKRQQLAHSGLIGATTKPDIDNITKGIFDSLNGVVYLDDKQIVSLTASKQYGLIPRVEVRVQEYEKEAA